MKIFEYPSPGAEKQVKNAASLVAAELKKTGIDQVSRKIHQLMLEVREINNRIHRVLRQFGRFVASLDKKEASEQTVKSRQRLHFVLSEQLAAVETICREKVMPLYQQGREIFQGFTESHLEEKHIGEQVLRSFVELTRQGKPVAMKKEELLNFQKFKLYTRMKPEPKVQRFFAEALKAFIQGGAVEEMRTSNLRTRFASELRLVEESAPNPETPSPVAERESVLNLVARHLTPKEVENLARFVPCIPRHELRLAHPPGSVFVEIAARHLEFLRREAVKQYVLLSPGEEKRQENEITFKELSTLELIKKAYGLLHAGLVPIFNRIETEKSREDDFVSRERLKWRREVEQITLYLQYLISSQHDANAREEGRFREFKPEEEALLAKYLSAEDLDRLEGLFGRSYTVDRESRLFEVEIFLVKLLQRFFAGLKQDVFLKAAFEETQNEKRRLHVGGKTEQIERKIEEITGLNWQKTIDQHLLLWEYGLNKLVSQAKQKLIPKVKVKNPTREEIGQMTRYIAVEQLQRIKDNLARIHQQATDKQMAILLTKGVTLLKIVQGCFDILAKDEATMVPFESRYRERLAAFVGDREFRDDVDRLVLEYGL